MSEILWGRIQEVSPDGITIKTPAPDMQKLILRDYDEVRVEFVDSRHITPVQNRKAHAIMGDIAEQFGMTLEEVKLNMKYRFLKENIDTLKKGIIMMRNANVTEARLFISMLIDFCLDFDVQTNEPLWKHAEDVKRYVYSCAMRKKCCVCGKGREHEAFHADIHHIDRVGMGRDRTDMNHIGMEFLPLCRDHHQEAHRIGDDALMEKYHLEAIKIDEDIAKKYHLSKKERKI